MDPNGKIKNTRIISTANSDELQRRLHSAVVGGSPDEVHFQVAACPTFGGNTKTIYAALLVWRGR